MNPNSQNSYTQAADFAPPEEGRTSVLAVMSLVFGVLCVPGLGLLGVVLGISALFGISRSQGRLRGQGMAVAGIIVGLVFSVIWVCLGIGAAYGNGMFNQALAGPAANVLRAIDAGDYKTARANLQPALATAITDEQLGAFGAAYQAELGKFKFMPESLGSRVSAYFSVGPMMQNLNQGTGNVVPIPAGFDKGLAVLLVQLPTGPPPSSTGTSGKAPLLNVGVLTPSGKEIWLLPTPGSPAPPPPSAPAPDGGPVKPPGGGGG